MENINNRPDEHILRLMTLMEGFDNKKRVNICEHTVKMVPHASLSKSLGEGSERRKEWRG